MLKFNALHGPRSRPADTRNKPRLNGTVRQGNAAGKPRRGDAALVSRLRDERDRRPRAPRRARRPEARASPGPVRDAGGEHRLEPAVREVRPRGRRGDGQVPPARRHRHLRHAGADGAGLLDALPARRRPGQLRLGRRRQRGGDALHRVPARPHRRRAAGRHRQRDGRFRPELRRQGAGADRPADAAAEPAGERLLGDRGRDGHQHPAAQPRRDGRCVPRAARAARPRDRGADQADAGARFPDRRADLRARRRARGLPHRARPRRHPRAHALRGHRRRPAPGDHRRRAALPGEQAGAAGEDRRVRAREAHRGHLRHPRRVGQVRHARGDRAEARRAPRGGPEQPLQADPAAGQLRHQHGRAARRPAEAAQPQADARRVPRAPARGGDPAHRLRPAQGAREGAPAGGPRGRAVERRRDHRAHQGGAHPGRGQAGPDGRRAGRRSS